MTAIDGTGLHALEHLADTAARHWPRLLLCGMRDQPARMMQRAEFHQHIEKPPPSVSAALDRARVLLKGGPVSYKFESVAQLTSPAGEQVSGQGRPGCPDPAHPPLGLTGALAS